MELEVYKTDGTKTGETVKLSDEIFGVEPNHHAIYRAVRTYLDNQRQGTAKVKTRGEVRGGGKKPFKQKTAYEMRISDWSSDVCSSDLARKSALSELSPKGRISLQAGEVFWEGCLSDLSAAGQRWILLPTLLANDVFLDEIGRASCRERVYVLV